ncbi:unnamed protein product [Linum trigynum]|uniref:Uncharacterized protein n=1 Tax=Linum trigynum TaxID=586398 RepID=A0AAV2CKU7_9ROSI
MCREEEQQQPLVPCLQLPTTKVHRNGQQRTMFIQTQSTLNTSSLMFYLGEPVMEVGVQIFQMLVQP